MTIQKGTHENDPFDKKIKSDNDDEESEGGVSDVEYFDTSEAPSDTNEFKEIQKNNENSEENVNLVISDETVSKPDENDEKDKENESPLATDTASETKIDTDEEANKETTEA